MIQRRTVNWGPVGEDDPWGEKAYYAALAARPKNAVRDHLAALRVSTKVTKWFRKHRETNVLKVTAENVIAALNRAGIRPVLMGTYGLVGYRSEGRATDDVDVLVTKRQVRKAMRVLEEAFPYLEIVDMPQVVRFLNPVTQKVVLDVTKPTARAVQLVFRNMMTVGDTHRIPTLEMALVSKFVAMRAPNRKHTKKLVDRSDFEDVVYNNRQILDLEKLKRLADKTFPNGGAEILRLIADIDAGRQIQL
jgi:hypothetical protein